MAFDETLKVWKNGKIIPWNEATIHVASHVVHYGSSVFEGIRCYKTQKGSAVFRLRDHVRRFFDSAKIYRMPMTHSMDDVSSACKDVVKANAFEEAYIRPVAFRGYGALGVDPSSCPVDTFILTWKWGAYLGKEGLERGVDVKVSSWNRLAPNTLPTMAKAGANYMSSQLMKLEAIADGYAESIALTGQGYISEGSGENLFVAMKGKLYTPPVSASILSGITRDSVICIAKELGFEVVEQNLLRESLYLADEVFFTGTAAEVTPIRSVDHVQVGAGGRGPMTAAIQTRFFDVISGKSEDRYGWLDYL